MSYKKQQTNILSLLEKAANSSAEGISISIMSENDQPLIYANKGFERLTGYSIDEVVGKNCRFLQGNDTDKRAIDKIREAIKNGEECTVELLNYRKDGFTFWNRLSLTPLHDEKGTVTHYVGIQSDITELKETKERLERANKDLEIFSDRINGELDQAQKAQQFMLPTDFPKNDKLRFCAMYEPMDRIGGDYYDIVELQDGVYGMMIADVTGHGIPAALLTFMTSLAFKNSALTNHSTGEVISQTNEKLLSKMPKGSFVTMFYVIYNAHSNVLTYTQAGHPPGFILRSQSKELIPLETKGGLLGVFKSEKLTFDENKVKLKTGDKVVLYTDAIVETRNKLGEMLEMEDFKSFLISNSELPIFDLFDKVYQFGLDFSNKPAYDDDFTLVGFEVLD